MPVPDDLPLELVNDFEALMEITWLLPLIAAAEILGGLFILQPKTRALGALIIFPVMVGVLLTHVFVDPSQLIMVAVIWAILGWIIYDNREKYQTLIG